MTLLSSYAHRWRYLGMLAGICLLLVACSTGGSASPPGLGVGNQQTPTVTGAPGAPDGVILTNLGLGQVKVAWFPTLPYDSKIDHYDVYEIHADNSIGGKVASVPATAQQLETIAKNLNLCTYYRFGVVAVGTDGKQSAMTLPDKKAFTWGSPAPGTIPNTVVIMAMGVNSHLLAGNFSPLDGQSYCTTADGNSPVTDAPAPLQDLLDIWDNQDPISHALDTHGPNGFGAGNRMIDTFASKGAVILPFSYGGKGATLSKGTAPNRAVFSVPGYTASDVGDTRPEDAAQYLDNEIQSIHNVWPETHIIVVGHSAGGLAVELWWEQYGQKNAAGVTHAFSLDSPINGAKNNNCSIPGLTGLCGSQGFGGALTSKVAQLWDAQPKDKPEILNKLYPKSPIFTAVGTWGDAVWDFADGPVRNAFGIIIDDNIGIVSQVFTTQPSCFLNNYDVKKPGCSVITGGSNFIDPCGTAQNPLLDGTAHGYGLLGSEYTHSVVKNCHGVITEIMKYFPPTFKATTTENPLGKVDWTKVITETDLGCNGPTGPHLGVQVDEKQFADVTGDGKKEAFVAVACVASTSSWPDRLEVFDGASDPAHPRLIATLLDYKDGTDERGLRIGSNFGIPQSITISGRTVTVVSLGYAPTDPDCCFSLQITDTFTWNGSGFTRGSRSVVQAKAP